MLYWLKLFLKHRSSIGHPGLDMGVSWLGHGSVVGWSWRRHGQGGHGDCSWVGQGMVMAWPWVHRWSGSNVQQHGLAFPTRALMFVGFGVLTCAARAASRL